jgi:hypothetical protein
MFSCHSMRRVAVAFRWVSPAAVLFSLAVTADVASVAGANAQEARPNRIAIEYVPPKEARHEGIYKVIKEHKTLEKIQEIFSPFKLPATLTLKTMGCGMSNAWYQRPNLTICYEYLEDIQQSIPEGPTPAGLSQSDVVLGQLYYVVAHEMGHAMFDQLNVPLFGRAEDAADGFATFIMLRLGKQEARRLIGGAAYSYKDYLKNPKVTVAIQAFSDSHGAPVQRFYNLLCLAYGADKQTYADLVESGYLPKDRARSCGMEYGELNFAFQQLIKPHLDPALAKAVLEKSWLPEQTTVPAARATDAQTVR